MTNLEQLASEIQALSLEDRNIIVRQLVWGDDDDGLPAGDIIAAGVSLEDYMENYAANFCEWVEGYVIKMSPVHAIHDVLTYWLRQLFEAYFELRPIGVVRSQPFVMRLPAFPNRRREPDLLVVLDNNPYELKDTYMNGPADICIEIISEESVERDQVEKFNEYEKGGVTEYWLIDPLRKDALFYRLNEAGRYIRQNEGAQGSYIIRALPGLALHVPMLWQEQLPGPGATFADVQAMLANHD